MTVQGDEPKCRQ